MARSDLSRCRFEINHEKSNWEPTRRISWIGYNIETHAGLIFASDAKIEKLCADLNDICASLEFSAFVHAGEEYCFHCWSDYFNVRQLWERYPDYDQIFAFYYQFSEFVEFPCLRARSSKARASFLERQIENIKWNFVLANSFCTVQNLVVSWCTGTQRE